MQKTTCKDIIIKECVRKENIIKLEGFNLDIVQQDFKKFVNSFIKELENKLKNMNKEYTVDRIEGDFVVCENRENGQIVNLKKENLPEDIQDGDIIKEVNGKYIKDKEKQEEIEDRIAKKMNDLWN